MNKLYNLKWQLMYLSTLVVFMVTSNFNPAAGFSGSALGNHYLNLDPPGGGLTTSVQGSSFCTGSTVAVSFSATGTFQAGNTFTAQLSNSSGSFASPVTIGSVSGIYSGSIQGVIPDGTPAGSGYRIRVVSSAPAEVGDDNGADLSVVAGVQITAQPSRSSHKMTQAISAPVLSVTASGGSGLIYQWYRSLFDSNTSGVAIGGATSSTYQPPTNTLGTAHYFCTVSNGSGCSVTSQPSGFLQVCSGGGAPSGGGTGHPPLLGTGLSGLPLFDVDGNAYDTVVIGNQVWFSENLKVSKYRNGDAIPTGLSDASWQATTSGAYAIHNNTAANDSIYGKLYNWYAVADPRGLCPTGWHVPSDAEWITLVDFLGGGSVAGGKMKAVSSLWGAPNTSATNSSGFTGLPGGYRLLDGTFIGPGGSGTGSYGYWWSSTQAATTHARLSSLAYFTAGVQMTDFNKLYGNSVRCAKDLPPTVTTSSVTSVNQTGATCGGDVTDSGSDAVTARGVVWSTAPNPTVALTTKTSDGSGTGSFTSSITGLSPSTTYYVRAYATNGIGTGYGSESTFTTMDPGQFTDIDGNIYDTIAIGTQVWMKQNLKVSKYRNGDAIPTGLSDASWQNTNSGAYAIYNNTAANDSIYGKLYNWYAVVDSRGLCPTGWHVPIDAEWTTLYFNYLGGTRVAGGKMKAVSPLWNSPNNAADNSSGFTGLPGGQRGNNGSFYNIGITGTWWTSTGDGLSQAFYHYLWYEQPNIYNYTDNKKSGFSVRCVRD